MHMIKTLQQTHLFTLDPHNLFRIKISIIRF